jgi:hypothetical protein
MHQLLARFVAWICSGRDARSTLAGQSFTGFIGNSPDANSWARTRWPPAAQWRRRTADARVSFRSVSRARG